MIPTLPRSGPATPRLLLLLAALSAPLLVAAGSRGGPEVIRASRYELLDAEGRLRGVWAADGTSEAVTFELRDANGATRILLGVDADSSRIEIAAAENSPRIEIQAASGAGLNGTALRFFDEDRVLRAEFGYDAAKRGALLRIREPDDGRQLRLGFEKGEPVVELPPLP